MFRLALLVVAVGVALPDQSRPLEKAWYSPHELLPVLAERDGIRWALPETLAGRAWVGGDLTCKAALDEACKQWGLAWTEANGVVVVHRADDVKLKQWTGALKGSGQGASEAAWELGWLRDARAVPALAEALAGKDPAISLAAAQAIDTLLTDIPLGRDERVDPSLPGRVSLATAFPPKVDLVPLLESPYPPVRAAALRVMLGQGGKAAEEARTKTAADRSLAVQNVRQQLLFTPRPEKSPRKRDPLPAPPKDPAELQAACKKMLEEQPHGVPGAGLVYDPFHKVLLLHSGRKATQFGGPDDAITWSYDVRTNTWTDLKAKNGPGNPWVGAMDFDPDHYVCVLFSFRDKQVWAYRHKPVAAGTQANKQ